jgi:hypothetical protein
MRGFRLQDVVPSRDWVRGDVTMVLCLEAHAHEIVVDGPLHWHSAGDADYQRAYKRVLEAAKIELKKAECDLKATYCFCWTWLTYSEGRANESLVSIVCWPRWQVQAVISWQCKRNLECTKPYEDHSVLCIHQPVGDTVTPGRTDISSWPQPVAASEASKGMNEVGNRVRNT